MARVLLAVDVEPASHRAAARLALEEAGYDVLEVHDGHSALEETDAFRPDTLLLDTALPGLDGFQVLDRLHRNLTLRHLPVVMMSTMPRDVGGELARSLGASHYLARPFSTTELAEAVAAVLPRPAFPDPRDTDEWATRPPGVVDLPRPGAYQPPVTHRPSRGA